MRSGLVSRDSDSTRESRHTPLHVERGKAREREGKRGKEREREGKRGKEREREQKKAIKQKERSEKKKMKREWGK